jgi:ATP-binding cassette subfamily C protein LapB
VKLPLAGPGYRLQVFVGGIAIHGLALALPIFMMQLYDRILPNSSVATLAWLAAAAILALLVEAGLRTARQRWASWQTERAIYAARRTIIDALSGRDAAPSATREAFAALRILLQDSYQQRSFFLSDLPFGLLYLGLIYLIHPYLCLTLASLGVLLTLYYRLIRPQYAEVAVAKEDLVRDREEWMEATFRSVAEWKALGAEEQLVRHHRALDAQIRQADGELVSIEKNKLAITKLIESLAVFGPLILGGSFVIEGTLTVGALTACVLLARRALGPLVGLAERWYAEVELQQARRKLFRLTGMEEPVRVAPGTEPLPEGPGALSTEGVILRQGFDLTPVRDGTRPVPLPEVPNDDLMVLRVDDVRWEPGAWVVFPDNPEVPVSDLFRAIRGLHPFFSGELKFQDQSLTAWSDADRAQIIALVEGSTTLFPGTLLENLSSFQPGRRDRAQDLGSQLGLDAVFEGLDRGYETPVTDRLAASLAPGVLQRIGLARALVGAPKVILLDRFDAALDPESRDRCLKVLRDLRDQTIVLYRGDAPDFRQWADGEAEAVQGVLRFRRRQR